MLIEQGRYYICRDGKHVGPAVKTQSLPYPWLINGITYTRDGRVYDGVESPNDLMQAAEPPAHEKLLCDVSLADYVRGVAAVWNSYRHYF